MPNLKGIFPPMLTPFTQDGNVDYDAFTKNVQIWANTDLAGLLVFGSNGETPYLNEEEKLKLVELTVANANGKTVMVGTGMETARDTIALTNKAADLGADCALILTPCFYDSAMKTSALAEYFTQVADGSKIPILVYNVPKFTHVNVGADLVEAVSKHPNIIGMKDSSGDAAQMAKFLSITKDRDFDILVGTAAILYPALTMGASGGVLALANCNPNECVQVYNAVQSGDHTTALEVYMRMFPVNAAVTATYGIAGLKHACTLRGFHGGYVRNPLQELGAEAKDAVEGIMKAANAL